MKLLEALRTLKAAIEAGDWPGACSAYEALSGERVESPHPHVGTPERRALRAILDLSKGALDGPPPAPALAVAAPGKAGKSKQPKAAPAAPLPDDGGEDAIPVFEEDALRANRPRPPVRPPHRDVEATCSMCGKTEFVHPQLVPPKKLAEDDSEGPPSYYCARCTRKGR